MTQERKYFAHSLEKKTVDEWQPLEEHLKNVADIAAGFARPFEGEEWAYLAGLWHDSGKATKAFQGYLRHENQIRDEFTEYFKGRVDHSTHGAKHSFNISKEAGKCLAYVLAGHHTGLLNWEQDAQHGLRYRIEKSVEFLEIEPNKNEIPNPTFLKIDTERISFQLQFFIRMIFSCLVDADFLDTEKFISPGKWEYRDTTPVLKDYHIQEFWKNFDDLRKNAESTSVNKIRESILENCVKAAEKEAGLFSLTVPTGGGKTLSSMAFALEHAKKYKKLRIIYVIPFTSIIEQNAKVFRDMFGDEAVLEHHCNYEPDDADWKTKLAAENWAAPIIVTTNVQFFNSFFANKTSKCRKLHNIANSIIIFDEVQAIPVEKLEPCLEVIKELTLNYSVTSVLCTATQPAFQKSKEFQSGLSGIREIVMDVTHTFEVLRRTNVTSLEKQNETDIAQRMMTLEQALCIVSTRKQAREIFEKLNGDGNYHLSALMYPEHRSKVLSEIKGHLKNNTKQPCRVISTQLIEAGVDVDFPVVFRALSGMDSIAQAAGRCNREGRRESGDVYIFEPESGIPPGYFRQTAQCAQQLLNKFVGKLLEPECIQEYFLNYYWLNQHRMDDLKILEKCRSASRGNIQFEDIAKFGIIKSATIPVVIALEKEAIRLVNTLNFIEYPGKTLRKLQKYSVQIYSYQSDKIVDYLEEPYPGVKVLKDKSLYSQQLGLMVDAPENRAPEDFIF